MQRTQLPQNKGFFELSFLLTTLNQIVLPLCRALWSFAILMMIMIIMSPATFLVLHGFQSTCDTLSHLIFKTDFESRECKDYYPTR